MLSFFLKLQGEREDATITFREIVVTANLKSKRLNLPQQSKSASPGGLPAGWLKSEASLENISVNVALYGPLARRLGKRYVASEEIELPAGSMFADLLHHLHIQTEERGYVFINSVLCDVPGLNAAVHQVLNTGDHVGIFSLESMWPYQYRDGIPMSDALKAAMEKFGAMHHTYDTVAGQETGK
jgi:hypothetical protein